MEKKFSKSVLCNKQTHKFSHYSIDKVHFKDFFHSSSTSLIVICWMMLEFEIDQPILGYAVKIIGYALCINGMALYMLRYFWDLHNKIKKFSF